MWELMDIASAQVMDVDGLTMGMIGVWHYIEMYLMRREADIQCLAIYEWHVGLAALNLHYPLSRVMLANV